MNATVLPLLLLLLQAGGPGKSSQHFHWDWRNAQELPVTQSLRNAKLGNSERAAIARAIATQVRPMMFDLELKSEADLMRFAYAARIKMIDLNGDGIPEVIVQGMGVDDCGAVGNCSFWVFEKKGRDYKLLLSAGGQTFTIQSESANGFKGVVVASQSSATDSGLVVYQYEGGAYKSVACYDANFAPDPSGPTLKEPRITPEPCG